MRRGAIADRPAGPTPKISGGPMRFRRFALSLIVFAALLAAMGGPAATANPRTKPTDSPAKPDPQAPFITDPVLKKIVDLGLKDNQVMTWLDFASNRFGGRYTGTDAYANAAAWALWQFKQFGVQAELDEAGEVPVGFNRGPWFGKMIKPVDKPLYFGTPTMTAGTKGVQRGPVVIAPAKEEDVEAMKDKLNGAWALIPGESNGFARDGRRESKMSPLTRKMWEAGCLGTIQMAKEPIKMMDGQILKWEDLPVLPDVKLTESQYNEIKGLVEKDAEVILEFDIRNWFKMGPVKYHNVVAWIPGSTDPDDWVIMGGHLDCFDSATGGVDDGSGFSPGMEALRLLAAAGAKPKRSVMMILFAAEENGLLGSQAWIKRHPGIENKIVAMINRDGSPSAIVGATVPVSWVADFLKITAPLKNLYAKFPFEVKPDEYPRAKPERPSGTDSSSFAMAGVPTVNFQTRTDYNYGRAWHTLLDTYSEVVPYTEQQKESALVTAVVAYGIANLDKPLPRQGLYLPDGLYADINTAQGRIMTTLDYKNAPAATAAFIRMMEGPAGPPAGAAGGRPPMGPGGPGGMGANQPSIGKIIDLAGGAATAVISSDVQKSAAGYPLPKERNTVLKHDAAGILGMSYENRFYLTLKPKSGFDAQYPAIGRMIAGADVLKKLQKDDAVRGVRIIRVGQAAKDFKTDNEAFKKLLEK
jgi:cyclophilin family peptidyl-prolyl cis-trans isomerase